MTRIALLATLFATAVPAGRVAGQVAERSNYRGWNTLRLSNDLIELEVAPDIGGRVIQFKLGTFEFLFVNGDLAGCSPPPSGVGAEGQWLNYGGEKLWPAPQGKDSPDKWDGPPDPVLDGSPHRGKILAAGSNPAAVSLVSRDDPRSGIRFSRNIQLFADAARVHVDATMTNVSAIPRRWGIWSVMQHNGANRAGAGFDQNLRVYCPLRADSRFPKGYYVMRGDEDNSSFRRDKPGRLVVAHYERKVGKIGVDNSAGWVATVHGSSGHVLVQRFTYFPGREYPDNASVEVWLHGPYGPKAALTDAKTFPYFVESELLSPLARLEPGQSYTFGYDWCAAAIGGNLPICDCRPAGVVCKELMATWQGDRLSVSGHFGVFDRGTASLVFQDSRGNDLNERTIENGVSPLKPLIVAQSLPAPSKEAAAVSLVIRDARGRSLGKLSTATIQPLGRARRQADG